MNNITNGFRCLEDAGWSDLIDKRWKDDVVKDLKKGVPGITDDEIKQILEIVLL